MHDSTNFKYPPTFVEIHCSCDKVYHKQDVRFLSYTLGQIVEENLPHWEELEQLWNNALSCVLSAGIPVVHPT